MAPVTVRVEITGRVQGVWYRGWTVEQATALGLAGWVRNRRDGAVEAVFAGTEDTVEKMLQLCRHGPTMARVDEVKRLELRPEDTATTTADGFHQRATV